MRNSSIRKFALSAAACLLAGGLVAAPAATAQKMKAEELVAKHLEAVGTAETRASVKSRIITGTVVAQFRSPVVGQVSGRAVLASQGERSLIGMVFDNSNYPHEKVGFDGENVTTSYVRPGVRSSLGEFLLSQKSLVRGGLLGGALSESWPLSDMAGRKPKLDYAGTKKVGARQAHELKVYPRGGSDLKISLFFDAETFQHIRTEYSRVQPAQMGSSPDASAQQRESRFRMTEEFSDFRKEGGLTLPHDYRIRLEFDTRTGTYLSEWHMALSQFSYNQPIDPNSYKVDAE
jgi:hypothetical protein